MTTQYNYFENALNAKTVFEIVPHYKDSRRNNTIAAAVGAVAAVGLCALSDKANVKSLAVTSVYGAFCTLGVHQSDLLHVVTPSDDYVTPGIIGGGTFIGTGIVGLIANATLGG